ncbi:MAG: adenylosuccinate lyase, partial [candidate division WOR-3 bacterium]
AERIILPLTFNLLHYSINLLTRVLKNLVVSPERMLENIRLAKGQFYSQSLLLALVKKGLKRSVAYEMVQRLSFRAQEEGKDFPKVVGEDEEIGRYLKKEELKEIFSLKKLLQNINSIFTRTIKKGREND